MKRAKAAEQIPPVELAILNILWDHGPLSVQEVQAKLAGESAYTTVQTTLNTMEEGADEAYVTGTRFRL